MPKQIDYYFSCISPFAYLGHQAFLSVAEQAEAQVHYRPIKLGPVFANSGALPLPQRPASRQAYRRVELARWGRFRQLPINLQPAYFPADPSLADRCVIAIQQAGLNPARFTAEVMGACWAQELNIADEATLRELLNRSALDADAILAAAASAEVEAEYERNSVQAVEADVLGSPAYLFEGEQFWGQDRVELLAQALSA